MKIRTFLTMLPAMLLVGTVSCRKPVEATSESDIRVKTMAVESSSIAGQRVYSGTIEESGGSAVSFPVAGTVSRVYVSVGDRVGAGQLIATLDAGTLNNTYEIAKAELDQAQDAYNRLKTLHDANSLPDIQWVEIQQKLRQAQSAEAIARRSLGDARLVSPISGYVSEKMVDAGMNVAPGLPVVKIVSINPVKVSVSIPENEISALNRGENAIIKVGALGDKTFTGRLTEKAVTANPLSRTYDVKLTVANPSGELLPGMICDVSIEGSGEQTAIVVPTDAVLLDADNSNFVWLDVNGHAEKRVVTTNGMTDTGIIVTSGLAKGDKLIVEGQQKVSNGSTVVEVNKDNK